MKVLVLSAGGIAESELTGIEAIAIAFTPTDGILADNAQAAIVEVDDKAVHKVGNETISGLKTFTNGIISGGNLSIPDSAWNAGMLELGGYYFWVDGDGFLRIKFGTPASINDGLIVGVAGTTTAGDVTFTPTGSIASTNVQEAIAEVSSDVATIATAITELDAADIDFTPTGTIASTDVAGAIAEVSGDVTTLDNAVVHKTGDETVGGTKTFTHGLELPNVAWNNKIFSIAGYRFWINSGKLYFKNGTPASATDGSVVGPVAASDISFTPTGTIAGNTVQAAIAETASEALQKSSNLSDLANAATAWLNLGGAQSLSANGWTKLPNGLILQWRTLVVASQTFNGGVFYTFNITFPISFNTLYCHFGCLASGLNIGTSVSFENPTISQVTATLIYQSTTTTAPSFKVFAIGI